MSKLYSLPFVAFALVPGTGMTLSSLTALWPLPRPLSPPPLSWICGPMSKFGGGSCPQAFFPAGSRSSPSRAPNPHNFQFPDLPVMMVTAYGDNERRKRAAEYGAAEFITKPVDFDQLKVQLRQLPA